MTANRASLVSSVALLLGCWATAETSSEKTIRNNVAQREMKPRTAPCKCFPACGCWLSVYEREVRESNAATKKRRPRPASQELGSQPFTWMLEKDRMALPAVGWPKAVAGLNVVKISMFFSSGLRSFAWLGAESTL